MGLKIISYLFLMDPILKINMIEGIKGLNELLNDINVDDSSYKQLCKKNITTNNNNKYKIIRYDKSILSNNLIHSSGLLRSVIFNEQNKLICFSPPKSIPWDSFVESEPTKKDYLVAEEFVEGTMINVFWDESIGLLGSWELATRNSVGGEVYFYKEIDPTKKQKTFREMFLEAADECNLVLSQLDRRFCYSFVLQHPENRIVVPFNRPALYLVEVYEICKSDVAVVHVRSMNMAEVKKMEPFQNTPRILFPKIYEDWETYDELKEAFASMNTPYYVMGFVIRNLLTGRRTKLRNPVYEMVRQLRGNQSKLQYQYLSLRKEGKVRDFLVFYPEYKQEFAFYRTILHAFTDTLYNNYVSCYIKKEKPLKEFPENFRTHMFQLHKKYIDELKSNQLYVSNRVVIEFVNLMPTELQMYSIHYSLRKREQDLYPL